MGLAASQARLLSITQRISDNELRAQLINNQKMRLATESSKVSENYINALNKTNLMFANYDANDNAQNVPLTFNNLTAFNQYNNQYGLTNTAGNILISENEAELYKQSNGNLEEYLRLHNIEYTTSYWDKIAGQLKDCESFYANPNFNNIVDASDGAWAFVGNPDLDITEANHTANLLKAMYEGTSMTGKVPRYEEIIKTKEYTDFASYVDQFIEQAAAIERAETARTIPLHDFFNAYFAQANIDTKIDNIDVETNNFGIVVKNISDIDTAINSSMSTYFEGTTSPVSYSTDLSNEVIHDAITNDNTKFESTGQYFYQKEEISNLVATRKTNYPAAPSATNYDETAQYLTYTYIDSAGTTVTERYARIADLANIDDENNTALWIKINSANSDVNSSTSTNFYSFDESTGTFQTYTFADVSTQPSVTYTHDLDGELIVKICDNASPATTETYRHAGINNTSATDYPRCEISTDTLKEQVKSYIRNYIMKDLKTKLNNGWQVKTVPTNKINPDGTTGAAFTQEEIDLIKKSTAGDISVSDLLTKIQDLVWGMGNTPTITSTSSTSIQMNAKIMTAFLNYVTSGKWQDPSQDIKLTVDGEEITITAPTNIDQREKMKNVVDAYILDTLMDVFGEPKYGYLYTDGNDNVIDSSNTDASAEAQWLINLFNKIQDSGYQVLAKGLANSTEWLQFALENGIVVMEQVDSEFAWQGITHTSCSDIIEQTAATETTIAEAEYNKAMRQIEAKDEMFDLELKNIDTEHSSLEAEYESVKKAMTGNIERSFQMYG